MSENLTYEDVVEYQHLFKLMPPFLLERMAKKNSNLVNKFQSKVEAYLNKISDNQRKKLDLLLSSDVDDLQGIMNEAYEKTNKKQYKILANPEYKEFIELNIDEIRKLV